MTRGKQRITRDYCQMEGDLDKRGSKEGRVTSLNAFFVLVFTDKTSTQKSLKQQIRERKWWKAFPWSGRIGLEKTWENMISTSP